MGSYVEERNKGGFKCWDLLSETDPGPLPRASLTYPLHHQPFPLPEILMFYFVLIPAVSQTFQSLG